MNLIRRSACLVVLLGAVAGCSGEDEGTNPSHTPGGGGPSMAPAAPKVPAKGPAEAGKTDASKKETPPAPAKTDESRKHEEPKKGEASPKLEGPKTEAGKGKGDTAAANLSADELAEIKKLPAADQELAIKQAVCPVSDEKLGEMGKPVKVTVEGRPVFLCCENCEKELKADSKKYIAKLDAKSGKK